MARDEIRAMCSFRQANLCSGVIPFSQAFDVILLRNVMLYLGKDTRRRLLEHVHSLMAGDGVLMLGVGEQATDSSRWAPMLAGGTCYYRPVGKDRK